MNKMIHIPVKFEKGDTIYTTKREKVSTPCPICEGVKTIKYNGKDMRCPECMGAGAKVGKLMNVVVEEPFVISTTKISINKEGVVSVKYRGNCGYTPFNRSEDNLFATKKEAQDRCNELNKEYTYIRVSSIVVLDSFKQTQPSLDKIQSKLEYYKENGFFRKDIVVDGNGLLLDGYITYLLCGLVGIETIRVEVRDRE